MDQRCSQTAPAMAPPPQSGGARTNNGWRLSHKLATLGTLALLISSWAPVSHAQAIDRKNAVNSAVNSAAASANSRAAAAHPSTAFWRDLRGTMAATSGSGTAPAVRATRLRTTTLDRVSMAAQLAGAPLEGSPAARQSPLVIALPSPDGGFQRFKLVDSPIMEAGLAARHPQIKTYAGRGIDDPSATLRMDLSQLGLHASVRSPAGAWYIDPYYLLDDSVYASYWRRDTVNPRMAFAEAFMAQAQLDLQRGRYRAADTVQVRGVGFVPGAQVTITVRNPETDASARQTLFATAGPDGTLSTTLKAEPYKNLGSYEITASDGRSTATATYQVVGDREPLTAAVGNELRVYRLALLTDPLYASFFGPTNVTAAKVTLINRVTQIYEDETSIRLVLIAGNDALNLNTAAQMTGVNGPCGGTACYTASQAGSCTSSTLSRTRQVIGLLAGASNFDIGHIALGANGGGVASLGVVGGTAKAQGCTGINPPTGDLFAVDFVAHEMGHQFAGNHTFNGTLGNCAGGNRSANNSVEPGSGSSIMAYAGICSGDNLQGNSDPYWSQRSFDEVVTYTSAAETNLSDVQQAALTNFSANGQQFVLRYNGADSAPIVRGINFTTAGVQAAIQGIPGWPAGATVSISTLTDTGFTVGFGGTLSGVNASELQLVGCSGGCSGFVGEITKGGATTRRGGSIVATGNTAPVVSTAAQYTIPLRTPFVLTGSATDADGDALTYMWEQTDRGAATGTSLVSNTKLNGPLFRQFSTRQVVSDPTIYAPPGQNATTGNPTRVFPDLPQLLINNTNAESGSCPAVVGSPTAAQIDCYSEFLPTAAYVGFAGVNASPAVLNFKLTARDGRGGVNSATTRLVLEPTAGPFVVTAPNSAVSYDAGTNQTVSWNVANTNVAPVNTANVKITLSLDGGNTFPLVLANTTPNSGSRVVKLPNVGSTQARVKVEALDNVFFDISNANFTIRLGGDLNGDGAVDCTDLEIVRASFGLSPGQPGFDPRADVNGDGIVNALDSAFVSARLTIRNRCARE